MITDVYENKDYHPSLTPLSTSNEESIVNSNCFRVSHSNNSWNWLWSRYRSVKTSRLVYHLVLVQHSYFFLFCFAVSCVCVFLNPENHIYILNRWHWAKGNKEKRRKFKSNLAHHQSMVARQAKETKRTWFFFFHFVFVRSWPRRVLFFMSVQCAARFLSLICILHL